MKLLIKTLKHLWKAPTYTVAMTFAMLCGTIEVVWFFIRQKFFRNYLPNYDTVEDNRLYRGGQPSDTGLKQLAENGVRTLVVLRTDCNTKSIARKTGGKIQPVHIPFNPYKPSEEIIKKFLILMEDSHQHPVFIHCFHGADRTGVLVAIYRIVYQGWTKERAIEEMKSYGFHWWHKSLIDFLRRTDLNKIKDQIQNEINS